PIPPDASLDYVTMSLNLNERDHVVNVQMRTNVHSIAGDQPGAPTKALFRRALYVLQPNGVSAKGPACMSKPGMHMGAGFAGLAGSSRRSLRRRVQVDRRHSDSTRSPLRAFRGIR